MSERNYLIWDTRSIVGNCALFWASDRNGYTCTLEKAGRYTREEAEAQARSRDTDRAVPLAIAEQFAVTHVRVDTGLQGELKKLTDAAPADQRGGQ